MRLYLFLIALVPALAMLLDMQYPVSDRGQSYVMGELVESFANTVRSETLGGPAPDSASDSQSAAVTAETQVAVVETDRDLANQRDLADEAEALMRDLLCRAGDSSSCGDADETQAAAGQAGSNLSPNAAEISLDAEQAPGAAPDRENTGAVAVAAGNENGTVAGTWTFEEISTAESETAASAPPVEVPDAPAAAVEETVAAPAKPAAAAATANTGTEIEATIPGFTGETAVAGQVAGQMDLADQSAAGPGPDAIKPEPEIAQLPLEQTAQAVAEASPPIEEPAEPAAPLPALSQSEIQEVATSAVARIPKAPKSLESNVTTPAQVARLETALAPEAGGTTQTASLVPPFSTPNDPIQSENESLVFLIQDRLNRLGYTGSRPVKLDGKLGPDTTSAITAYQRSHDLSTDGRPSLHLLNHLDSQLTRRRGQPARSLQASLAEPEPANARGGYESFRLGLAAARGGQAEDAIKFYTEAVDTVGWLERHLALAKRGDVYSKIGNYDMAITDYSAAIRLKPDYADAYVSRAFAYQAKDEDDKAVADYRHARRLDPDNRWIAEQLESLGAEP